MRVVATGASMFRLNHRITLLFLPLAIFCYTTVAAADEYEAARQNMVKAITEDVVQTSHYLGSDALAPKVLQAMAKVPRHEFVPKQERPFAYQNRPLPIGYGQTISQPYIVAVMTELLKLGAHDRVLELGTGSGYQAAILSELADKVYSIEIIDELGNQASSRLARLGYDNVRVKIGDGYYGWPEHAPFDAIVVTAAGNHIPPPLIKQLKIGGRMIIPVGSRFMTQQLLLVEKPQDNKIITRQILPVSFVPITGGH